VTLADLSIGVRRFVIGFGKKMLVANVLAGVADQIFALPVAALTPGQAWLGVACYTLQIYFDFSGYSDMAIGLARLFGFRFPENFDYPYVSRSIQEFWRRWHLSLSAWFRDYVYVPLGGSRLAPWRTYANLCTVFLLCGLWHGASWTFVVWGLYHGAFLVLERWLRGRGILGLPAPLGHVYALLVVMAGWVFFRADSLAAATGMLRAMAGASAAVPTPYAVSWYLTPEVIVALACGGLGATPIWPALARCLARPVEEPAGAAPTLGWRPSMLAVIGLAAIFAGSVMLVAAHTYNPFIYFRF
jgi:alginate O-acetyltransferase complex protein AlgI